MTGAVLRRYGYSYACSEVVPFGKPPLCLLPQVGFRGAPCSDAAGSQVCLKDIIAGATSQFSYVTALISEEYINSI